VTALVSQLWWIAGQIKTCESKVAFPSRGKALWFANRHGYPMHTYRCPVCNEWHLTSNG
jgi:hypothetical protein